MKTRTKRNSNKKTLATAGLVALAAVSVFSVGFASWVIGSETTKSTDLFGISIEEVTDSRVQILEAKMIDKDINFGAALDSKEGTNPGLITSETNTEDLTFAFNIVISKDELTNFQGFNFYYSAENDTEGTVSVAEYLAGQGTPEKILWPGKYGTDSTAYIPLVAKNMTSGTHYVTFNGTTSVPGDNSTYSWRIDIAEAEGKITFTITANIKWGAFFGNRNPVYEEYPTTGIFSGKTVQEKATMFKEAIMGTDTEDGLVDLASSQNKINIQHPTTEVEIKAIP